MLPLQIDKPLDRAAWWIEHLICHPNLVDHMRLPVHDLHWYQLYLLDVMALLAGAAFAIILVIYKLLSCICRCGKKGNKKNKNEAYKKRQ
jgi:glucuronosyltransferase